MCDYNMDDTEAAHWKLRQIKRQVQRINTKATRPQNALDSIADIEQLTTNQVFVYIRDGRNFD